MAKKIKYGNVDIGPEEFKDENVTALISIRLPLTLLKELKRLSLTEKHEGRYQVYMRDVLQRHVDITNAAKAISPAERSKLLHKAIRQRKQSARPAPRITAAKKSG